jgi:hypothetical protein
MLSARHRPRRPRRPTAGRVTHRRAPNVRRAWKLSRTRGDAGRVRTVVTAQWLARHGRGHHHGRGARRGDERRRRCRRRLQLAGLGGRRSASSHDLDAQPPGGECAAGVGHYVAVSIVGVDLLPDSGYLRAKVAQESEIEAGDVSYTILRRAPEAFVGVVGFWTPDADSAGIGSAARIRRSTAMPEEGLEPPTRGL